MKPCSQYEQQIINYLLHEVTQEQEVVLLQHLEHCEACRSFCEERCRILKHLGRVLNHDAEMMEKEQFSPQTLQAGTRFLERGRWSVYGAIAAILFVGFWGIMASIYHFSTSEVFKPCQPILLTNNLQEEQTEVEPENIGEQPLGSEANSIVLHGVPDAIPLLEDCEEEPEALHDSISAYSVKNAPEKLTQGRKVASNQDEVLLQGVTISEIVPKVADLRIQPQAQRESEQTSVFKEVNRKKNITKDFVNICKKSPRKCIFTQSQTKLPCDDKELIEKEFDGFSTPFCSSVRTLCGKYGFSWVISRHGDLIFLKKDGEILFWNSKELLFQEQEKRIIHHDK